MDDEAFRVTRQLLGFAMSRGWWRRKWRAEGLEEFSGSWRPFGHLVERKAWSECTHKIGVSCFIFTFHSLRAYLPATQGEGPLERWRVGEAQAIECGNYAPTE